MLRPRVTLVGMQHFLPRLDRLLSISLISRGTSQRYLDLSSPPTNIIQKEKQMKGSEQINETGHLRNMQMSTNKRIKQEETMSLKYLIITPLFFTNRMKTRKLAESNSESVAQLYNCRHFIIIERNKKI